ncbi:hypothetical protein, partial [Streptomyces sp. NPDC000405]|uniref:hypothetical protein n=1 Tax=Streptomyces sp. NPDC000405 TaxID=3161033 RepID=UPI00398CC87F
SIEMDGVSTYLALTFGTLLSSQGTDASFVLTLSGFPPGFPSVFPTLPDPFSVPSASHSKRSVWIFVSSALLEQASRVYQILSGRFTSAFRFPIRIRSCFV